MGGEELLGQGLRRRNMDTLTLRVSGTQRDDDEWSCVSEMRI